MQVIGYGTSSHVAHHDFFGFWIKFGLMTKSEDEFVYNSLTEGFEISKFPPYPIADNIDVDWDNTNKSWTVKYDYINPDTTALEIGTEYQWYIRKGGFNSSLEEVFPLAGPNGQNKTLKRADFPNDILAPYPSLSHVYCGVKVQGSWRELHGPYIVDNIK